MEYSDTSLVDTFFTRILVSSTIGPARPTSNANRCPEVPSAWHSAIDDPVTSGHYTLRVYTREKVALDGSPHHTKILLKPINPEFEPIVLMLANEEDVRVMGSWIECSHLYQRYTQSLFTVSCGGLRSSTKNEESPDLTKCAIDRRQRTSSIGKSEATLA